MKENTIKIHLNTHDSYKNKYNNEILSNDLFKYILDEIKGYSIKQKIKFHITSDFELTNEEKDIIIDMIRNSFGTDISEIMNASKKKNLANGLILFVGIIFLILYTCFNFKFLSEFILILGWVFIGEAICNFLYNTIENKLNIIRRKQITNAKVIFK